MILSLMRLDDRRGLDDLYNAQPADVYEQAGRDFFCLKPGPVGIVTGFWVNGHAETDGPPGAWFLALALQNLGWQPTIITDTPCLGFFPGQIPVRVVRPGVSPVQIKKQFPASMPYIAIERCGRDEQGYYRNMRGVNIGPYTAPLDELFLHAPFSLGFGDGGNEIGMGNYADFFAIHNRRHSVIRTTHCLPAVVSNRGVWGFLAALEQLSGKRLLPAEKAYREYMEHLLACGAVDGFSGLASRGTDGFSLAAESAFLAMVKRLTRQN